MMGTFNPWTDAELAHLRRAYDTNRSDEATARELGRSVHSVAIKRSKLGLTNRKLPRRGVEDLADHTLMRELRRRGFVVSTRAPSSSARRAGQLEPEALSIFSKVARHYGLDLADMKSYSRDEHIANARNVAFYLVRRRLGMSYPEIGAVIGRHHTTIMSGVLRVEQALARWPGGAVAVAVARAEEACS